MKAGAAGAAGALVTAGATHVFGDAVCVFADAGLEPIGAEIGSADTVLRLGCICCCGAPGPYVAGGIGVVFFGSDMNGSTSPGRFGVTPGESRRRMCGVIMTTSSVLFF